MGFSLAGVAHIKTIYIHKKVQPVIAGIEKPGRQIDVLALTDEGKVIVVEVTTQNDLNHIMNEIRQKEKLAELFSYDWLVYVTAAPIDRYIPFKEKKSYVLGMKHLLDLEKLLTHIIEGTPPHELPNVA